MEMTLSQKILVAIYLEYQKEYPDTAWFNNADKFNTDNETLQKAFLSLEKEGLIKGLKRHKLDQDVDFINGSLVKLTDAGNDYIENNHLDK